MTAEPNIKDCGLNVQNKLLQEFVNMFFHKPIVVCFILQNIVSSLCGTVQVDVDPESEASEYMNSSGLSESSEENDGVFIEFTLSAFFNLLQSIFISGPELLNSINNFDDYLDTNVHKKMPLIIWESNSNEDSDNSFEEYWKRYTTSNWGSFSNEDSDNSFEEYWKRYTTSNWESFSNEDSDNDFEEYWKRYTTSNWESFSNEDSDNSFEEYWKRYTTSNWESFSNEDSDNDFEEYWKRYTTSNWESFSNEDSDNSFEEYWKRYTTSNWESFSNEDSENNFEEYSERYTSPNWDSYLNENSETNLILDSKNNYRNFCAGEELSMISHTDIKYLIEEKAERLKIKENIVNGYYSGAAEVLKKNIDNIEEFKKLFKERPGHMLHVLHSIRSWRQGLEPSVEEIAAQLDQFHNLEDSFKDVAKGSAFTLNQLEKYKKICKINCEDVSVENRFGHDIINNSLIVSNRTGMYCVSLKDLNDYINEKLSEEQAQYFEDLDQPIEDRDKLYQQNISELINNLKEAAVKQFGMTMYDILSLHDDYHHFMKDLEHVNISSEIYNIAENTAEIGFIRIGLKRDLEKYRQYCMKCVNQRVKRKVLDYQEGAEGLFVIPIEKIREAETNASFSVYAAVDELIQVKINAIKESIQSNFTTMFEELDEIFNDPNVIDTYVRELHPIQEVIKRDIEKEQEALYSLRSRIPIESIDKIIALSKESKQMIRNLESAKIFIDQFIQKF